MRVRWAYPPDYLGGYATPMPGYGYLGNVYQGWGADRILYPNGWHYCADIVGFRTEQNPLYIEHGKHLIGKFNGQNGPYYYDHDWGFQTWARAWTQDPSVSPPSENRQMTHAIDVSAPYTPRWSATQAIVELKDFGRLPEHLRDLGHEVLNPKSGVVPKIKVGNNTWLLWTFGIQPLVQDVKSLLNFSLRTDKRAKQLMLDSRPGGGSHSVKTFQDTTQATPIGTWYVSDHYGAGVTLTLHTTTYRKNWGSCSWQVPAKNLPPQGSDEFHYLANRLANGIDITPKLLWELMPWTFLIDWCTNIGDFIDLSYNIIGADSGRYCLMKQTKTIVRPEKNPEGFAVDGSGAEALIKERVPMSYVLPEVSIPFITDGMASIIGSLHIQQALKGVR